MLEPRDHLDLARKSIGVDGRRDVRQKELDRDLSAVLAVVGKHHHRHPPRPSSRRVE
jgi:hypothetical protein